MHPASVIQNVIIKLFILKPKSLKKLPNELSFILKKNSKIINTISLILPTNYIFNIELCRNLVGGEKIEGKNIGSTSKYGSSSGNNKWLC